MGSAAAHVLGELSDHPLENPAWYALTGPQADFAESCGRAVRFRPDMCPFAALPSDADDGAWADLATLGGGAGSTVVIAGPKRTPPQGWTAVMDLPGVQFDGTGLAVGPDPDALVLGPGDVPEMLDLVERTRPGPFRAETIAMGAYLGFRDEAGALVAMAGERMRPPGWTEISGVCIDPAHRGRGLATRLVRAVGAVIRDRGDVPFLHTTRDNTAAIHVYEAMGFLRCRPLQFAAYRVP